MNTRYFWTIWIEHFFAQSNKVFQHLIFMAHSAWRHDTLLLHLCYFDIKTYRVFFNGINWILYSVHLHWDFKAEKLNHLRKLSRHPVHIYHLDLDLIIIFIVWMFVFLVWSFVNEIIHSMIRKLHVVFHCSVIQYWIIIIQCIYFIKHFAQSHYARNVNLLTVNVNQHRWIWILLNHSRNGYK